MGHLVVQVKTEMEHWVTGCGQTRFFTCRTKENKNTSAAVHALPSGQLAYFYGPLSEMKPSVTGSSQATDVADQSKHQNSFSLAQWLAWLEHVCLRWKCTSSDQNWLHGFFSLKEYNFCFSFNLRILFLNHEQLFFILLSLSLLRALNLSQLPYYQKLYCMKMEILWRLQHDLKKHQGVQYNERLQYVTMPVFELLHFRRLCAVW